MGGQRPQKPYMKKGVAQIDSFSIICPHCNCEQWNSSNGSRRFRIEDIYPKRMVCTNSECFQKFKMPIWFTDAEIKISRETSSCDT